MLIFEQGVLGRVNHAQRVSGDSRVDDIPEEHLRRVPLGLPEVSELQVVRHFTRLSQKNFAIDKQCYPLGSCTMKYNPRGVHEAAMLHDFLARHPLADVTHSQGFLSAMFSLQAYLQEITGMEGSSLTPMAGAQGEWAGVAMIRAYHASRGDGMRNIMLVPTAAHGTNPATASMCAYEVRELPVDASGDLDLRVLSDVLAEVGDRVAGIMLTNPSTLGVFERSIQSIADQIHAVGGLLYYDGANLNAILGRVRPAEMGFDVMHMNLHKTFATPHGGGGPGSGAIACRAHLVPFLPVPRVVLESGVYRFAEHKECPQSIGRLSAFMGNAGILLRAYAYIRMLGKEGIPRVSAHAVLNANYLSARLQALGFPLAYPKRRATHEFIITLQAMAADQGVQAMDFAKRLLDYGFHAPTVYFPLLVPECMLVEPTETEDKATLDAFVEAMAAILREAADNPELVKTAPHTMPCRRLDDVRAARQLDVIYQQEG